MRQAAWSRAQWLQGAQDTVRGQLDIAVPSAHGCLQVPYGHLVLADGKGTRRTERKLLQRRKQENPRIDASLASRVSAEGGSAAQRTSGVSGHSLVIRTSGGGCCWQGGCSVPGYSGQRPKPRSPGPRVRRGSGRNLPLCGSLHLPSCHAPGVTLGPLMGLACSQATHGLAV